MPPVTSLKRVLVTGASGFIGRALCPRLEREGAWVRALMRRPVSGPWHDVAAVDLGAGPVPDGVVEGLDTVFHLAGKAHAVSERRGDNDAYHRVTVKGTRALLDAASRAGVERFVFFSSVKATGEASGACLDECATSEPATAYGRTKREAERLVLEAGRETGLHGVNLRLPLVYGPGAKGNLPRMLRAIERGRFPPLPECGNKRSLVHVEDVVSLALTVCRAPQAAGQTYLVTDGRVYSTRAIYDMMCVALGKPVPAWSVPRSVLRGLARCGDAIGTLRGRRRFFFDTEAFEKLTESAWYSSGKAERELGFRATRGLDDALPAMVTELREGREAATASSA